ncbi:MAG: carboxypeptidase-like regulatory domain-containing protein [Winogradskyella sp.]|nr:carboxypeptidase-like regulatory domain-containing protein [Winogradskyella sp.]
MKKKVLFILLVAIFASISAQSSKELFIKLIDSETSQSISYATVILKGSSLGVIADFNGEFRIPMKYYNDNKAIIISSIGYKTEEVPLNSLDVNKTNILKIATQIEALDAVIVTSRSKKANELVKASRRMTAIEIVRKAIAQIPENLSKKPHSYVGYYRDYQLVDNRFHNLNEAILETFDQGINTNFLEKNEAPTAVYSFKQNTNFIQDMLLSKPYGRTKYIPNSQILPRGGNEYLILNIHNPIRNYSTNTFSYVYNLERDFPNLHYFKKDQVVFFNDEPLILIEFKYQKPYDNSMHGLKKDTNNNAEGSIYISLIDYSIHRFNYKMFIPSTKNLLFNVNVEYIRKNDQMYLNYITFNNTFVAREDTLKEEEVLFDNLEQAFYITFNNTKDHLNENSHDKNNFKFKLGNQQLKTLRVKKISERQLKVSVKRLDGERLEITEKNIKELSYTLKRIEDVKGRKIYKRNRIKGDQFREFFVQQIHLDKPIPKDLNFMNQNSPIKKATLNQSPEANQYWINSPLMDKKYRDADDK